MSIVVPFDGSDLSRAALRRADAYRAVLDERVVAVTVVPRSERYAREHGWLDPGAAFDDRRVVAAVHEAVADIAPAADFRHEFTDRRGAAGTIARKVRDVAREEDASVVFVGSEDAGNLVSSVSSVGSTVAADDAYDVFIVRHADPEAGASPSEEFREKSDFNL